MSARGTVGAFAAGLLLSSALWWLEDSSRGSSPASVPAAPLIGVRQPADDDVAALRREVAAMRRELAAPRPTPVAEPVEAPIPPGEAGDPAESSDRVQQRALAQRLAAEPRDAGSDGVERAAQAALLGEAMAGSHLVQIDCRTSLCRVELSHDDGDAGERFAQVARHTAPFNTEGLLDRDASSGRTLLYVARAGHSLDAR